MKKISILIILAFFAITLKVNAENNSDSLRFSVSYISGVTVVVDIFYSYPQPNNSYCCYVSYGVNSADEKSTQKYCFDWASTTWSIPLNGLISGTTYKFQAVMFYPNFVKSAIGGFATLPCTGSANFTVELNPTLSSALLTADPNNTSWYFYQWYLNGAEIVGGVFPTYIATITGDYSVMISNSECNILSPILKVTLHGLGIDNQKQNQIKIYPNPFKDILHVELPDGNYNVTIVDMIGKIVQQKVASGNFFMDRGNLKAGFYLLRISSESNIKSFKINVE